MLRVEDLVVAYGAVEALHGVTLEVGEGEIVTLIGGERRRQDDDAAHDLGAPDAAQRPRDASTARRSRGVPAHRIVGARHLPRARGPAHLHGPHRAREPRDGGLRRARARRGRATRLERVLALFPRLRERDRPARRHALRRRAADARDRPRPHGRPAAAAARRAEPRARAAPRPGDLPRDRAHQPGGRDDDPPRRAERAPGPLRRAPRLRARDRPHRARGRREGASSRTRRSARPTWGSRERAARRRPALGRARLGHVPRRRAPGRLRGARAVRRLRPAPARRARRRAPSRDRARGRDPPRRRRRPARARRQRAHGRRHRGAEGPLRRRDRPRGALHVRARAEHDPPRARHRRRRGRRRRRDLPRHQRASTSRATPTAAPSSSRRSAPSPAWARAGASRAVRSTCGRRSSRLRKADIARLAVELGVPGRVDALLLRPAPSSLPRWAFGPAPALHCGRCDACRLRRRGFHEAGLADPTAYAR